MAKNNLNKKEVLDHIADAIEAGTYTPPRKYDKLWIYFYSCIVIAYAVIIYKDIQNSEYDFAFAVNIAFMAWFLRCAWGEYKRIIR